MLVDDNVTNNNVLNVTKKYNESRTKKKNTTSDVSLDISIDGIDKSSNYPKHEKYMKTFNPNMGGSYFDAMV